VCYAPCPTILYQQQFISRCFHVAVSNSSLVSEDCCHFAVVLCKRKCSVSVTSNSSMFCIACTDAVQLALLRLTLANSIYLTYATAANCVLQLSEARHWCEAVQRDASRYNLQYTIALQMRTYIYAITALQQLLYSTMQQLRQTHLFFLYVSKRTMSNTL
jgi:hypothetical protein